MKGLWEQVYQGQSNGSIPGWLQCAQIAAQGGRVAGNVDDLARLDAGETFADLSPEAGTRWVYYDEVRMLRWRRLEEAKDILRDLLMTGAPEIADEIGCGGGR
jgi:hypothetical protein